MASVMGGASAKCGLGDLGRSTSSFNHITFSTNALKPLAVMPVLSDCLSKQCMIRCVCLAQTMSTVHWATPEWY